MKNKSEMSDGDFQKLIRICMNDLTIQRTLLENDMQEQRDDLRTLEQDQAIDKLERRIMLIKKDYEHYSQFADPSFADQEIQY
ncbi:hypothetical protein [Companilactobacillus mishanensis]|uniref:Uncharacterized protein n=1 Tax=Companilactobacillus mishanensis TaxID=2486008 RepID=A0A5P0ZI74_9LACO|nr:hypothetical protein [Companilactobacillus mishanensis]MQS45901.1 hypothetical protein [Companilactobacillus mishanensis]MQS52781.1 hypothetical protein [Companilactobacillus mishanensis]MQS89967.1 hypothetical protein [Companilactobacillus mishanensis]